MSFVSPPIQTYTGQRTIQKNSLNELDILLFSGSDNHGKQSRLIKMGTGSPFSHVGIVTSFDGELFVGHSAIITGEGKIPIDPLTKKRKQNGVMLSPLSYLETYSGEIFVRKFTGKKPTKSLAKFFYSQRNKGFERNKKEMYQNAWFVLDAFKTKRENHTSFFCSELVAAAMMYLGMLPNYPPSNHYSPADFAKQMKGYSENLIKLK